MNSNAMKRFLSLALLLLLSLPLAAQRPKVGVVLCGGGAKGAAHVGALKVLEENNIPIDYIAGTSMGAIIAGLYAIGYTANELDSLIMAQDWNMVMSDRIPRNARYFERKKEQDKFLINIPFGAGDYSRLGPRLKQQPENISILSSIPLAIVNGQNIYNLFSRLSVGYQDSLDFNRMPIPFACVAVDLIGKKEVEFHSGNFVDAIRSSMAIPGYFSPVRIGDKVLVDGGALNNYPVDVCREMGADIIIGVLLGEVDKKEPTVESIGDLASELMDLYTDTKYPDAIAHTDILITPSTKGYNVLSFDTKSLRALIDNGEAAARDKEPDLQKMKDWLDRSQHEFIGPIKQPERYKKAIRLDRDSITLKSVNYTGLSPKDAQWLIGKSGLKPGAHISGKTLDENITDFYNTGAFESVTYVLRGQEEPYDLDLNFVQGRKSSLGIGFRFDSEEIAAVLVNVGINTNALYGSQFNISAKLSYNIQANVQYSYAFKSLAQFKTGYTYRSSNLDIFEQGLRNNLDFNQHTFHVGFATKLHDISVNLGARLVYYDYDSLLSDSESLPTYDTDLTRTVFPVAFARFQADSRDDEYFPTRGTDFDGEFGYYFNKLINHDYNNFMAARLHFSGVIPVGDRFAIIGSIDNRTLFGSHVPLIYANVMGGAMAGRYMDQQLPFIGFGYTHVFKNVLSIATLDTRARIFDNHYVYASGAYARDFQNLQTILDEKAIYAARLGYAYNSFVGPLGFNVFWSSYTKKVGFYINLGYSF